MDTEKKNALLQAAQGFLTESRLLEAERYCLEALLIDNTDATALQLLGRCRYLFLLNPVTLGLMRLRALGFQPRTIADIGAYKGHWTEAALRVHALRHSRVLMLEAQTDRIPDLEAVKQAFPGTVDYRIALLGREAKEAVPFHLLETGSSVYKENTHFEGVVTHIPMTTLADVAAEAGFSGFDLIKMDVQGSEIDILSGSPEMVRKAEVIILEASLVNYNEGAPQFSEVVSFMDSIGFVVFDVLDMLRRGDRRMLYQCDLVFVRKDSPLRPSGMLY